MNFEKMSTLKTFIASAGKRSGQLALSALVVGVIDSMGIHSPEELAVIFGFTVPFSRLLWNLVNLFGPNAFWKTLDGWDDKDPYSKDVLDRLEKLELTRKTDDRNFRLGLSQYIKGTAGFGTRGGDGKSSANCGDLACTIRIP